MAAGEGCEDRDEVEGEVVVVEVEDGDGVEVGGGRKISERGSLGEGS
jgi:hypothetical protein